MFGVRNLSGREDQMLIGRIIIEITVTLALAFPAAFSQSAGSSPANSRAMTMLSSPASGSGLQVPAGDVVREIDDPSNGDRWLLVPNSRHPAGPGLLLLASTVKLLRHQTAAVADLAVPVVRTGDRVVVEENTPIVEARLEAVAMSPAMAGAPFNARLSIGGRVIRAVASGPGRAIFLQEGGR